MAQILSSFNCMHLCHVSVRKPRRISIGWRLPVRSRTQKSSRQVDHIGLNQFDQITGFFHFSKLPPFTYSSLSSNPAPDLGVRVPHLVS
ncbi:unnamed protein product [Protopolystoma xenopodis]|uniref:Uncharacterized protein n=1 Tax=Protopolystoma xenopodis TaxID=117903 RepID=A0A448WNQ1_9PLAT|nr:unnamed protein product [Protopolystoma xenopodis]